MSTQNSLFDSLKPAFAGDIDYLPETLTTYSHDASIFEIRPRVVVFPKDSIDVQTLVHWVNVHKKDDPTLSITARAAGTDMSGAAIGASIVMDCTRYMNKIIAVTKESATAQPGCLYRDFDTATQRLGSYMPAFTSSRQTNAIGGMVGNNSGGEKAIKYGKTERYVKQVKMVLSDAQEYTFKALTKTELDQKMSGAGVEAEVYKKLFAIISEHYDFIMAAKPTVSKNSAGYYLWNVYDKNTGIFDICQLIVGSQGTLGILTEITFSLVPVAKYSNVLAVFLPSLDHISELVTEILPFKPDSLETFDDKSLMLAVTFFSDFYKQMSFWKATRLSFQFIPEVIMTFTKSVPKMILMIEYDGETKEDVQKKLEEVYEHIKKFGYTMHIAQNSVEADKYWRIRHESFNFLRFHTKGKSTAPFIDDVIVKPEFLPEFLPKVKKILDEYHLDYTVQGHMGNGNFHIIPLMDFKNPLTADTIFDVSHKVFAVVMEYHGSMSAEHNDGIVRTPYLAQQFGQPIVDLFLAVKKTFDLENIFNPGKKVAGTYEDIRKALKKS